MDAETTAKGFKKIFGTVKINPLCYPMGKTIFISEAYKFYPNIPETNFIVPVNLKVIAYDGELIGMTVELFDTEQGTSYSNFLVFLNDYRLFELERIFKKKKDIMDLTSHYFENFGILEILKREGFNLFLKMANSLISKTNDDGSTSAIFDSKYAQGK